MARLKRKKDKLREAAYGRHSPAGYKHIKRMEAKGKKWTGTKWVDTMAQAGLKKRLRRASPELVKKKEIERTALSKQTKKQLQGLGKEDYKKVMKMLKRKR